MNNSKFKNLSEQDKTYIKIIHKDKSLKYDERVSLIGHKFDISERNVRKWIKQLGFSEYKEIENEEVRVSKLKKYSSKYIILTWAQNATPVHRPFWENILAYAKYLGADVGVIPGRYKNPNSIWTSQNAKSEYWDEVFTQKDENGIIVSTYLDSARQNIHPLVDILSDIKIVPTTTNPLSGLEGLSASRSCIVGHPTINLKSLPVLKGHPNKLMLTTGACTLNNYTDTKSGAVGSFHHVLGFVILELKDDFTFYVRQVTAEDNGNFIDLCFSVKGKKVEEIDSCAAFVFGDIHASELYHPVMEETIRFFKEGLSPRRIVLHDLFNGESVNHHEADDPFLSYDKWTSGRNLVSTEIKGVFDIIDKYELLKYQPIVVKSNHDDFLSRWLRESNWKKDVANSVEYMQYSLALLKGKAKKGILPYLLEERYGEKITCLDLDTSFKILGWELAQHGHIGTHGSRGSLEQYSKLNTKIITGHSHVPGRKMGSASVGTYALKHMTYNHGPSSWMHSGILIHNNGKIQHLLFAENDKFTMLL